MLRKQCEAELELGFLTQPRAENCFNLRKGYTYLHLKIESLALTTSDVVMNIKRNIRSLHFL